MTPEERAEKREVMVQGMVAKGHSRERAEQLLDMVGRALFGPGGRFAKEVDHGSE
jgi:DNA polymerase III alpha subunit